MDIGIVQIIVFIVLLAFGSIGYIVISEVRRPRYERIIIFMGRKGDIFLSILILISFVIFIGSAIYLGFTAWILCAIGVPLNFLINSFLSPIVLRLIIYPIYRFYELFYRSEKD